MQIKSVCCTVVQSCKDLTPFIARHDLCDARIILKGSFNALSKRRPPKLFKEPYWTKKQEINMPGATKIKGLIMKAPHAVCIYSSYIIFHFQTFLKKLQGATRVALMSRWLLTPTLSGPLTQGLGGKATDEPVIFESKTIVSPMPV